MGEFRMPSLGADMDEGTLLEWKVAVGDVVARGDIVAVVHTDKSDIEVEVFEAGTVAELLVEPGTTVPVGTALARIGDGAAAAPSAPPDRPEPAAAPEPIAAADPTPPHPTPPSTARGHAAHVLSPMVRHDAERLGVDVGRLSDGPDGRVHRSDVTAAATAAPSAPTAPPRTNRRNERSHVGADGDRTAASPLARRLAARAGVDLASVAGSGPGGAVRARDLPETPAATTLATTAAPPAPPAADGPTDPKASMRAAIARTMERSNREIPHYYLATTVDVERTASWLAETNEARPPAERLLIAALQLRATALAAAKVRELNGTWVDGGFRPSESVNLGVIIALRGGGLIAPIIADADRLSLEDTMERLRDLVERARRGTLRGSELSGASITVTNLGEDGVEEIYGVIHPPQVAIVGFGGVSPRPVAVDGLVGVHRCLTATLAADHRQSDGRIGGRFLSRLAALLADPERLTGP